MHLLLQGVLGRRRQSAARSITAREAAQRYKSALLLNFLRYGQAGPLPLARSFERHLRAENRSQRTITTYLIGPRQAETFRVRPDRARYGLPRPALAPVRRTGASPPADRL